MLGDLLTLIKKGILMIPFFIKFKIEYYNYTEKLSPQPQVREALGLSK